MFKKIKKWLVLKTPGFLMMEAIIVIPLVAGISSILFLTMRKIQYSFEEILCVNQLFLYKQLLLIEVITALKSDVDLNEIDLLKMGGIEGILKKNYTHMQLLLMSSKIVENLQFFSKRREDKYKELYRDIRLAESEKVHNNYMLKQSVMFNEKDEKENPALKEQYIKAILEKKMQLLKQDLMSMRVWASDDCDIDMTGKISDINILQEIIKNGENNGVMWIIYSAKFKRYLCVVLSDIIAHLG
jgi:hypothetical protein